MAISQATGLVCQASNAAMEWGGPTARVGNIQSIAAAYGQPAADKANLLLRQALAGCRSDEDVEAAVAHLSTSPVSWGADRFHLAVTFDAVAGPTTEDGPWREHAGGDPDCQGGWAARYRRDMNLASEIFSALANGLLDILWQPVRAPDCPERALYYEALSRIEQEDGELRSPEVFIAVLERLDLTRVFDWTVVSLVLDELERHRRATLGVNISGQSARLDIWWTSLLARIKRRPDVARRLIVEITETAKLADDAPHFAEVLRKQGVRVALDDFGVGHASFRNALAIDPDIIKIDAFFLRRAAHSQSGRALFEHLLGISASISPTVIVEGVETETQSDVARQALSDSGAAQMICWQQGFHLGGPARWRPWRHASCDLNLLELPPSFGPLSAIAGSRRAS